MIYNCWSWIFGIYNADELLKDAEPLTIAASADRRSLFVKGRKLYVAGCAPDTNAVNAAGQAAIRAMLKGEQA